MTTTRERSEARLLVPALMFTALVVAAVASLGTPFITFSVLGFVAGKLTPRVRTRIADPLLLAGSAVVVGGGFALFAAARSDLAELFAAMGVLGFGVG
ncbi:MFS transporter, partial [Streptomyces sp. NPDC006333]